MNVWVVMYRPMHWKEETLVHSIHKNKISARKEEHLLGALYGKENVWIFSEGLIEN